ncbi:hypothetical protein TRFO_11510 [Tritrichomonas foetus]|uniref:CYRIA/CYRIB Rac1 binding domain-containing protein n=1 Tax=Tritrichomonas foetus TaxID=1144522 RepID=A0A1J4J2U2_9EUKA|nr:hypothetical protein TRFO_11510 [Tritrichomonas foetus]|eukprot:OHS93742.1 hypothetical protein TRFO_11510 [Tritrichomonas foetus]
MSKGRFEDTEILIHHSELILAYLEKISNEFREDGKIMTKLKSSTGQQLMKFSSDYVSAIRKGVTPPTISGSVAELREVISMDLCSNQLIQLFDYTCYWIKLAQFQLQMVNQNSREYDLRWNLPVTLGVCKLFNAYCKICMYIHKIPSATFLVNVFSSSNLVKTLSLLCRFDDLLLTVRSCQESPFAFISSELDKIKDNLSVFVFQILPFFSTLFADWPIFQWSLLSIYEYSPEDTVGLSMPLDEFTLLANISTFQEMMTFFLMSFPDFMDNNQQFATLGSSVFTESSFFYLSRNYSIKSSELIRLSQLQPTGKTSNALSFILDNLEKTVEVKNTSTHLHRMKQLIYLAEDIENFAGIDFNQFVRCIHQIRAICAFSYYEIEMFFRLRDQKLWDQEHIVTTTKLLALVDKITEFFVREKFTVERFFIYNLSTADSLYLNELINKFNSASLGQAGGDIIKAATTIHAAIKGIDLNEFDSGVKYDFLPLLLTHGRALHRYNQLSSQLRISYMNPLFEHLASISLHCQAAHDATRFFLECCPIHTLWRHHTLFTNLLKCDHMPINNSIAILHSFSFFNYDNIVLPCYNKMIDVLRTLIQSLRGLLSGQIRAIMNKLLANKNSTVMRYSFSGDITNRPTEEQLRKKLLDQDYCTANSLALSALTQANQFISMVPDYIHFYGEKIEIASFFITSFSNDVIRILLFTVHDNSHAIIDASQFVWSLFGNAGIDYRQALFNGMISESLFADSDIVNQAKCFTDPSLPQCPRGVVDEQRVVHKIASELREFIEGGHNTFAYVQSAQKFTSLSGQGTQYSTNYFVDIFRTFGMHAATYLDCSLTKMVLQDIIVVVCDKYPAVSSNLSPSTLTANIINSNDVTVASASLLRVAVGLTLRQMVRRAITLVVDETIPGVGRYIATQFQAINGYPEEVKMTLNEVVSSERSFYFIKKFLADSEKCSADLKSYFTYIAAMILNTKWDKISFMPNEDALSNNMHLLPYAFELMVEVAPLLFDKANPINVRDGIDSFFLALSNNYTKRKAGETDPFLILIDKFTKFVPGLDYSKMEQLFPYTMLSSAYPVTK